MLVLNIVKWGAFASSAAWVFWALSKSLDADIFFGLACAAGSFVLGALFAGLNKVVLMLGMLTPVASPRDKEGERGGLIGFLRALVYGFPLR